MTHTEDTFNPSVYVLGGKPELKLVFENASGYSFTPVEVRLSIKAPDGAITTVSGSAGLSVTASGIYTYLYKPASIGWYEYEGWGKDSSGREIADTSGFEVVDRLYP
jgi:hypothetical protein